MDALLQNIPKTGRRLPMGVSLGVDLSGLDVAFGGFSPTVLGDAVMALDKADEAEARVREHMAALRHVAEIEAARASAMRAHADACGNSWEYVVLDGAEVRIEACRPVVAKLDIPAQIEGLPVVALAADACARLSEVVSVMVPDTVVSIGYCAFRNCPVLRSAVLPAGVTAYDSGWFRGCAALEELELPGSLDKVQANIFDNAGLKRLRIGAGTQAVQPGAFAKSMLERIEVDERSPFLETDGVALYARGRTALVAMAVRTIEYEVAPECTAILRKALDGMGQLRSVKLPDGVREIGAHAFAHTALRSFKAPAALESIEERAFFDCARLTEVQLGERLKRIGAHAFTRTAIRGLTLPATIESIGHPVAADAQIAYAGPGATLRIAEGAALRLDAQGALLRACDDGLHLEWLVDPHAEVLRVPAGVVAISPRALLNHRSLREVHMADTVREIGEAAFKGCRELRSVRLSRSLERIGAEAFLDTEIEQLELPASLESIGAMALVTAGAHSGHAPTALKDVRVEVGNGRFCIERGMLIERSGADARRVVHYMDNVPDVAIPDDAVAIAPYAFSGARGLRSLRLREGILDIGMRAFAVDRLIELIRIDLDEPLEGHACFEVRFPATDRGEHQQFVALTSTEGLSTASLLEHYDSAIAHASSFDAVQGAGSLGLYEQATRIVERLLDPVCMTAVNRALLERVMQMRLLDMCAAIAKHDDRRTLDALADLGMIDAGNLDAVLERLEAVQDAAMTGYLLEMGRRRFGRAALDFGL